MIAGVAASGYAPLANPHAAPVSGLAPTVEPTPRPAAAPAAVTHGDLVVSSGETFYIPSANPPPGHATYFQGGNITVEAGGHLVVSNTTLSFVQFVGETGVPATRLGHVFHFTVQNQGTVVLRNSTLTTTTVALNPYLKLQIVVNGQLTFWNSTLATAGSISVGSGGILTFNQSAVAPNPAAGTLNVPDAILGDAAFAPTLNVSNGGAVNLFASSFRGLYADNFAQNGTPGPLPLMASGVDVANSTNWSAWSTPTDVVSLAQDYAYPNGIVGGNLSIAYSDSNPTTSTTARVTVWYGGANYSLGAVTLHYATSGTIVVPFSAGLVDAINTAGMLAYLNFTGDFGLPSNISVAFEVTSGPDVGGTGLSFRLAPKISFDLDVTDPASRLSTVDSTLGLNFAIPNASTPWTSHKLVVSGGSTAYLANLTVAGGINTSSPYAPSAIVTLDSSHAYLYRWAQFSLMGLDAVLGVLNGTVTAQYAYGVSQLDNTTAKTLNDLSTENPAIWGYVQYSDGAHGAAGYGKSNVHGVASLLLASNDQYATSAPGGDFLGDYHIIATIPIATENVQAFNWSVSPYPMGVANGTPGYGLPDFGPQLVYPGYFAKVSVATIQVTANGTISPSVRIGQVLGFAVKLKDNGTAPIRTLQGVVFYNAESGKIVASQTKTVYLTAIGQTKVLNLNWTVNDAVTGLQGHRFSNAFVLNLFWNSNIASQGGGAIPPLPETVTIFPSQVAVRFVTAPSSNSLEAATGYFTHGYVIYNGSGTSVVQLTATPTAGGSPISLGVYRPSPNGTGSQKLAFGISWNSALLATGTSYVLTVTATYNQQSANYTMPGTYEIPTAKPSNFLFEKFLGEPLWLWLVILGVVVAAVLLFLLYTRRRAAGKLVECGECGNLIPEAAKICPKCGAEFEPNVVRCSRCASTIPADSQFCPECAAQLLGKPVEGAAVDPDRQAYADFTEPFRAVARKELGANYTEGAFWDWWKRQSTYTPFGQWKTQQGQGASRTGAAAPPPGGAPPSGGGAAGAPPPASMSGGGGPTRPGTGGAEASAVPAAAPGALRPCPSCGKQIPPDYLVCPFCGAVTQ